MDWESFLFKKLKYLNDLSLIKKAYDTSSEMHSGMYRDSGDEYISHPAAVAGMVADIKGDEDMICASLLHDTVEDTRLTLNDISDSFGEKITYLVDGLTKEKDYDDVHNKRKLILYSKSDVRCMIIKLADRMHNMKTIDYKKRESIISNSKETLVFYTPIARVLEMNDYRKTLEDICFQKLNKEAYDYTFNLRNEVLSYSNLSYTVDYLKKIYKDASVKVYLDSLYETFIKFQNNDYVFYKFYVITDDKVRNLNMENVFVVTPYEYQKIKSGIALNFEYGLSVQKEFEEKEIYPEFKMIEGVYESLIEKRLI